MLTNTAANAIRLSGVPNVELDQYAYDQVHWHLDQIIKTYAAAIERQRKVAFVNGLPEGHRAMLGDEIDAAIESGARGETLVNYINALTTPDAVHALDARRSILAQHDARTA